MPDSPPHPFTPSPLPNRPGPLLTNAEHHLPVGRLAPSPTGAQHVGNARTYLVAWLSARSRGGAVRLRIEDIDSPRVRAGAVESLDDDLRWLGLDWDGEPVVQTLRLAKYEA